MYKKKSKNGTAGRMKYYRRHNDLSGCPYLAIFPFYLQTQAQWYNGMQPKVPLHSFQFSECDVSSSSSPPSLLFSFLLLLINLFPQWHLPNLDFPSTQIDDEKQISIVSATHFGDLFSLIAACSFECWQYLLAEKLFDKLMDLIMCGLKTKEPKSW